MEKSFIDKAVLVSTGEEIAVPVMAYVEHQVASKPPTGFHRRAALRFVRP